MNKKSAVLWTGGKDCALAFFKAKQAGYTITHLVTFSPKKPSFKAHPMALMKQQIKSIGLPHLVLTVEKPMQESYENAIAHLKTAYDISTLITGDIDEIEGHPSNWIEKCSVKSNMNVYNPLWKKDRTYLLNELIHNNFKIAFSLVKKPHLNKNWVGKILNQETIKDLKKINIDICGENGEYHTMALNTPFFNNEIVLDGFNIVEHDNYFYLKK